MIEKFLYYLRYNDIPFMIVKGNLELRKAIINKAHQIGASTAITKPATLLTDFPLYPYLLPSNDTLEKTSLGISIADYAIAETGGIVEFYTTNEEKLVSILPEFHFIIVKENSILKDLNEFMKKVPYGVDFTIITGPSKTADIEKIIVKGAHGPREIFIFILK